MITGSELLPNNRASDSEYTCLLGTVLFLYKVVLEDFPIRLY